MSDFHDGHPPTWPGYIDMRVHGEPKPGETKWSGNEEPTEVVDDLSGLARQMAITFQDGYFTDDGSE